MTEDERRRSPADEGVSRSATLVAGLWNAAQMGIPLLGTAAVSIVIGRLLGPGELGAQSLISYIEALLVTMLIQTMVLAGIQVLAAARGKRDAGVQQAAIRWLTWGQTAAGTVSAIVLFAVGTASQYSTAWYLAGVTAVFNAVGWNLGVRVIATRGWAPVAKRRLATQLLAQALAVALVFAGAGIVGVFAANMVAAAVLAFLIRRIAEPARGPAFPPLPRQLLRLWGLFGVREGLTQVVAQRVEFLFLGVFSTTAAVAMYSIPFMVVTSALAFPLAIMSAAMPSVAAHSGAGRQEQLRGHLHRAARITLSLSIPITAGVAVLGPRLVTMLYGEQFAEAGQLTTLMSLILLTAPAFALFSTYWGGYGRLGPPLIAIAAGGTLNIAAAFALVPPYDALGATIANIIGQTSSALILFGITRRRIGPMGWNLGRLAGSALASGAAGVAGLLVLAAVSGPLGWILAATAMAVLLAGYGRWVGLVGRDDARWLADGSPRILRSATRLIG